jgi:fumarate reductase subunit C
VKPQTTKALPRYTQFHPRWYRPHVSVYWWLGQWQYLKFILRELSSVFVAAFVVVTLLELRALRHGPAAYARFDEWLRSPAAVVLNLVIFLFVLFHTITWFNLAPSAIALRIRGRRMPDVLIAAANYGLWLLLSLAVAWVVLR